MYNIYPVSLPFGRSGGSQDTIIVFIELITAFMSAGTEGAKIYICIYANSNLRIVSEKFEKK